jgi:hypothetical protein
VFLPANGDRPAVALTIVRLRQTRPRVKCILYFLYNYIRDKSGIDPEDLRQYSTHFEQIEESLSDSRAKHIDRRRAIEDADWQED